MRGCVYIYEEESYLWYVVKVKRKCVREMEKEIEKRFWCVEMEIDFLNGEKIKLRWEE